MHRVLFEVGPFTLYSYGVMLAASFVAGVWLVRVRAPAYGFSADEIQAAAVPTLLAGLLGAKLLYLLAHHDDVARDWPNLLPHLRGGFVFYGGLIGGAAGAIAWLTRGRRPVLAFGDLVAPGLAVSLALGRIGCWLNGCCYGRPASWGWAVPGLGDGVPRHPVPLYETAGALGLAAILLALPPPPVERRGARLGLFAAGYAVLRFSLEVLRDDPRGPALLGLSVSQTISLLGLGVGAWLFLRRPSGA